jgi:lysophospholipase L1-like esterase
MTRNWFLSVGAIGLVLSIAACEDDNVHITGPKGQEDFARYVSIGTSVSMGVQSDGVFYSTQQTAWPALLAHQAFANKFTIPLIQGPGCYSPLITPIQFTRRLSGAAYPSINAQDQVCALLGTITLPTNNVAMDGATTYAALRVTPETTTVAPTNVESDQRKRLYRAVLAPGKSQVTSMMAQKPTLISIELGANEALRTVLQGNVVPAAAYRQPDGTFSYYPISLWQPQYDAIVDSAAKTGAKVLLVSVPLIPNLVGMYPGDDFYQDRAAFASFGVTVSPDCQGNANQIYAFQKVLVALATKPSTLSCADNAGAFDQILTPDDITFIDNLITQMNAHVQSVAAAHSWAYLDLNIALASFIAVKSRFSLSRFLSCTRPFGQYISLDGIHPTADGQQVLANAAADALNTFYGFEIPLNPVTSKTPAQLCP